MTVSADVDERTLREIYLPAFERVVTAAQPWTVMCSYNRINGVYASEDPWLLTTVLREEWGFEGLVVSDWGAVNRRDAAVAAGLDLEMPSSSGGGTRTILDAVRSRRRCPRRTSTWPPPACSPWPTAPSGAARSPSTRSTPTPTTHWPRRRPGQRGPAEERGRAAAARRRRCRLDRRHRRDGPDPALPGRRLLAGQPHPTRLRPGRPHGGHRRSAGRGFAAGYVVESDTGDPTLVDEAVAAAAAADVAVVFLGLPPSWESEGYDRSTMDLPAAQVELLEAVAAANPGWWSCCPTVAP